MQEIRISSIKIGSRHRKDLGDLHSLARSIRKEGLLQPVGITEDGELIFGERRLLAVRDDLKKKDHPRPCRSSVVYRVRTVPADAEKHRNLWK